MLLQRKCLKRMAAALAVGVLCITSGAGAVQAKEQPTAEQAAPGLVVGRLAHNMSWINVYFLRFNSLSAKGGPKNSSVTFEMEPAMSGLGTKQTTFYFAKRLPAGKYQLTGLGSINGAMTTESKLDASIPTFEVTSGGVTDLGLLVVQPTGGGKAVLLPVDDPSPVDELVRTYFPDEVAAASGAVTRWPGVATWAAQPFTYGDTDSGLGMVVDAINAGIEKGNRLKAQARWQEAKTAADYLAIAKTATTMLSEPAVAADGTMYFGSGLGQVQRRAPDGTWSHIDSGLSVEISALSLLPDDTLAIGTEDGRLLRQESAGGKFVPASRFTPTTRVLDLHQWADGTWWVTTRVQQGKDLLTNVHSGKSLAEIDTTTPVKTMSQAEAVSGFVVRPFFATSAGTKTKYFVGIAGVESHTYDSATATWTSLAKKAALQPIANNTGSVLVNMKSDQFSTDEGASWSAFKDPGRAHFVAFFNPTEGLAVRTPTSAFAAPDMEVHATTDGGKTWSLLSTLPKSPCDLRSLRQNDVQKRIFCVFHDGSIHSAGMQGGWVPERIVY
ncbi:hypothetical protein ACFPN2_19255 [Steroidobacter flavus]|uniref:Uncharacterized protein n=1 Tax=Steroidobacter flavus TaxID=1842136 RepID=A0ABV8SVV8_9GAMM